MSKLDIIYGYVELHETIRFENGRIIIGSHAKKFDRFDNLLSESQNDYVTLTWEPAKEYYAQQR